MSAHRLRAVLPLTALIAVTGYCGAANGKLVQWNLQNVTFDDGGVATGFLILTDACPYLQCGPDYRPLLDYDIQVSGGKDGIPAFAYKPSNAVAQSASDPNGQGGSVVFVWGRIGSNLVMNRSISFNTLTPLSDDGGTVSIRDLEEHYPTREGRHMVDQFTDQAVGKLVGMPIPEASKALFLALGLLVVGAVLRGRPMFALPHQ